MHKKALEYILKVRLPIILFVIAFSFLITFYISRPERDGIGYSPEQPVNFSHKLHAGDMQIDCKYCHTGAEETRHASVPSVNICMNCHKVARKDSPEIIKLTEYFENGIPVQWQRVHKIPDYAYFDHSAHVNKGIECSDCHGQVEQMEKLTQARGWTMTACLNCHRNPQSQVTKVKLEPAPTDCWTCHR